MNVITSAAMGLMMVADYLGGAAMLPAMSVERGLTLVRLMKYWIY
jgi:hypothetical protein